MVFRHPRFLASVNLIVSGCLLGILLIMPGCIKQLFNSDNRDIKEMTGAQEVAVKSQDYPLLTDEEKARLLDIPFPLVTHIWNLSSKENDRKITLKFFVSMLMQDVVAYYRTEMEYWGWQELGIFVADESCLVFGKPTKQCIVQISPIENSLYSHQYKILIFIGPKIKGTS